MSRMAELANFLRNHDDYVLLGHLSPDGDTAGSCIGLALALRALGKRAAVHLPGGLPEMYKHFDCPVEIAPDARLPFAPKTAFAVDVSEFERLGDGRELFLACEHSAMLDHHETNPGFGEVWFVDGDAAATGELAVELIAEMGVALTAEMATWLYIAISTDSGRFGYASTRAETMEAGAACLRAGIDVDGIVQELYRTRSEGRTRLLGLVLAGLELDEKKEMCWARATNEMFQRAHALREDNEGIVNYLVEMRGVRFACLAEERGNGTKFSLRSKQPLDVAMEVAVPLGGGGHACAAGVTLQLPMEEALEKVLAQARRALDKLQETDI